MDVRLRLADVDDELAVRDVDRQVRGGDAERCMLIRAALAERRCVVAEHDGRVVGCVVFTKAAFFGRDFVDLLVVHEAARRRGVGRALLAAAVRHEGTARVFSSTNRSNTAMRSLFAAEGWSSSGALDGLDDGDPELVYFVDRPAQMEDEGCDDA